MPRWPLSLGKETGNGRRFFSLCGLYIGGYCHFALCDFADGRKVTALFYRCWWRFGWILPELSLVDIPCRLCALSVFPGVFSTVSGRRRVKNLCFRHWQRRVAQCAFRSPVYIWVWHGKRRSWFSCLRRKLYLVWILSADVPLPSENHSGLLWSPLLSS